MFISNGNGGGLNSASSMEPDLDCQWIISPFISQQTYFISLIFDGKKTNLKFAKSKYDKKNLEVTLP